jgi:hypothetical protein
MAMPNKNVVTKVVGAYDVENYTLQGWRLEDVLQESHVESFSESVPLVVPGQSYPTTYNGTKGFVVTKNLFVMTKDGSTLITEANARVEAAEVRSRDLANKLIEADKKTATFEKDVAKLKADYERQITETNRWVERHTVERDAKVKMEKDISKIRNAVGELKMKEILAS